MYEFELAVTDSTAFYDLALVAKLDQLRVRGGMDLEIRWYSPDNQIYIEKVWLPLEGQDGKLQPYRDGMCFRKKGNWHIKVYRGHSGWNGASNEEKRWDTINCVNLLKMRLLAVSYNRIRKRFSRGAFSI